MLIFIFFVFDIAYSAEDKETIQNWGTPDIIERIIKVEGTVDKPRVIFIIPRARLWREDFSRKSFVTDILKPVYPEFLIKKGEQ